MIINQTTTVTFFLPEEWEKAEKFKEENPDWIEEVTTVCRSFSKIEHVASIRRTREN